jgi:hypothetical protein
MKKEMTLRSTTLQVQKYSAVSRPFSLASVKHAILRSAKLVAVSHFYSRLLEMPVTPSQTLRLLHSQVAFLMMAFPVDFSLLVRTLMVLWFALTLVQCRRAGLK